MNAMIATLNAAVNLRFPVKAVYFLNSLATAGVSKNTLRRFIIEGTLQIYTLLSFTASNLYSLYSCTSLSCSSEIYLLFSLLSFSLFYLAASSFYYSSYFISVSLLPFLSLGDTAQLRAFLKHFKRFVIQEEN
jgi:hypothetical protein